MKPIVPGPCIRLLTACALLAALSACGGGGGSSNDAPQGAAKSNDVPQGAAMSADVPAPPGTVLAPDIDTVSGTISGLNGAIATVILSDQAKLLRTTQTDGNGRFQFTGVPSGAMYVKAEAEGYQLSAPQSIERNASTLQSPEAGLSKTLVFSATAADANTFQFSWNNLTGANETGVAHINVAPVIQFLGEALPVPHNSAGANLLFSYNITLSDKGVKWNQEYAARLLTLLGTIPTRDPYSTAVFRMSKWELTDQFIDGDIRIERNPGGDTVLLSTAAFVYATPRLVTLDGVQGRFFSKRLHHALVRFATKDGTDADAVEQVMNQRFGVSTRIDNYSQLTASTTREGPEKFARFKPEELVQLINAMEEMPVSFHKIDGLKYLLRRAYGQVHPVDPRIIADANPAAGYIEFTDQALIESQNVSPQRVIVHEKTHFLWAKVFSEKQKSDWISLGGWYRDPHDATTWRTTQTTQFVSAYGHDTNPEEDMAESVASYVANPELLQARASDKFNYLKKSIFLGDRFVSVIRKDLTFDVANLKPDYEAPGLVKQLDIKVVGAPTAPKRAEASIELFDDGGPAPGAEKCLIELNAPSGKYEQRKTLFFLPKRADGTRGYGANSTTLYADLDFTPEAERGYWQLSKGTCNDMVGNTRYLGAHELGNASLYINNAAPSSVDPQYEPGSMTIQATPITLDGHVQHRVTATWKILPHPRAITVSHAHLQDLDTFTSMLFFTETFSYDRATRTATATFIVPYYFRTGHYGITRLQTFDDTGNYQDLAFPASAAGELPRGVTIVNPEGDSGAAPELDLNRITVAATPTQPAAPNGETIVKVSFYARDDAAGFSNLTLNLKNPQGEVFSYGFTAAGPGPLGPDIGISPDSFRGVPNDWQRYEASVTLPVGSVPGTWGIQSMQLRDRARFGKVYEFSEIVLFSVSGK